MDIITFLQNFVNKSENIKELITLFLYRGEYKFGALFYKKSNTIFELIEHISLLDTYNVNESVNE